MKKIPTPNQEQPDAGSGGSGIGAGLGLEKAIGGLGGRAGESLVLVAVAGAMAGRGTSEAVDDCRRCSGRSQECREPQPTVEDVGTT